MTDKELEGVEITQKLEIVRVNLGTEDKVYATCGLDKDGKVILEGDDHFISRLRDEGIRNYESEDPKAKVYPSDGINFLRQLPRYFKNPPYLSVREKIVVRRTRQDRNN